jgi:hypothetical protein
VHGELLWSSSDILTIMGRVPTRLLAMSETEVCADRGTKSACPVGELFAQDHSGCTSY